MAKSTSPSPQTVATCSLSAGRFDENWSSDAVQRSPVLVCGDMTVHQQQALSCTAAQRTAAVLGIKTDIPEGRMSHEIGVNTTKQPVVLESLNLSSTLRLIVNLVWVLYFEMCTYCIYEDGYKLCMHASIYESIYAYVRSCVCMYVCVCVYKRASMGDYVHLYMCVYKTVHYDYVCYFKYHKCVIFYVAHFRLLLRQNDVVRRRRLFQHRSEHQVATESVDNQPFHEIPVAICRSVCYRSTFQANGVVCNRSDTVSSSTMYPSRPETLCSSPPDAFSTASATAASSVDED